MFNQSFLDASGFVVWVVAGTPPHFFSYPPAQRYGRLQVNSHGFIANRMELISQLELVKTPGILDEHIFAAAYERWGNKLQAFVLGEYAVAIFESEEGCLFATHDALAMRSLFYSDESEKFACASHLGRLIELLGSNDLDEAWIGNYLAFGTQINSLTVYKKVQRLGIGRSLCRVINGLSVFVTWSFEETAPTVDVKPSDLDEHFRSLLDKAISSACDQRTWAELSGGLDSSSVVCAALHAGIIDMELVSIIYSQSKTANEQEWMEELVREHPIPWHQLDGDEARPFSVMPDRYVYSPTPTILNWQLFQNYNMLLKEHNVHTVLTGMGGDNVLFGPTVKAIQLADQLRGLKFRSIGSELRAWQAADPAPRSLLHLFIDHAVKPLLRKNVGRSVVYDQTEYDTCTWLNPEFKKRIRLNPKFFPGGDERLPTVEAQFFSERISMVAVDAAFSWNQLDIACDFRSPLMYRPLVEFMNSLPSSERFRPGQDRVLQRRALKNILPEAIRNRRTKRTVDEAIFRGLRMSPEAYTYLTEQPIIVERGYVDSKLWKEAATKARFGCVGGVRSFLAAASLELWLRQLRINNVKNALFQELPSPVPTHGPQP